ncbi:MAG: hypothetical protein KJO18_00560, partial [Acidimicrobiia bacterium]|nr:hypothetical protein [Acidimicrobiia bacterium]
MILHRGETVTSGSLADILWGDEQPLNPANALQTQISYLRKRLAVDPSRHSIVTRAGGYALEVGNDAIDAHRFEQAVNAVSQVHRAGPSAAQAGLATLDEALALWRGPALADVAGEDFAVGETTRLEEMRLVGLEVRGDLFLLLGRHRELAADLAVLVSENPFRERFHHQLMVALYRSGRQAEALRVFANARRTLVDELGIEPGAELRDLERRILDQDPTLDHSVEAPRVGEQHAVLEVPLVDAGISGRAARRGATLPAAVSPLVGRAVEMERVGGLLKRSRMVTLTGPAGAGKTRLAIETARCQSADDNIWFVDLGDVTEPDQVLATVATALNVPIAPNDDAAMLARSVSELRGLLVLDTCEHVVGAVAGLVGPLLREAADMRVLATSRRALNVTGEIAWPVPPLALAPARTVSVEELPQYGSVELFLERASGVRPDFELTEGNAADIAAVCMALDGLPLAIELAAARVDVLSPGAIRDRLLHRFDLLVDGARDVPPRQQTLRGAIEWSIDMLDDEQRLFFAHLGVFSGSFDLGAASCVADVDETVALDLLTSLVRQSMVTVVEHDRYRLLDTLAAYALEMLGQLDADATRTRHADCYLRLAERAEEGVQGSEQRVWLRRLRDDLANHRVALEWAVSTGDGLAAARHAGALGWPWVLDGMLADADRELERVLAFPDLPPSQRSKLLWSLALLASSLGQMSRAEALAQESVACGRQAGDAVQTACGLNALAVVQWAVGDLDASEATRDEAITMFERTDARWGLAVCRVLQTRTAIDRNSPQVAELAEQGLEAARATTDRHLISIALEQVARLRLRSGFPGEAVNGATEALAEAESIGYVEGILGALHLLGMSLVANGDVESARQQHMRALALASQIGHTGAVCEALEGIAIVSLHEDRRDAAGELLRLVDAERALRRLPRRAEETLTLRSLGVNGGDVIADDRTDGQCRSFHDLVGDLLAG